MMEDRIPAFRESGKMTTLAEVIGNAGNSAWAWRLVYFEGTSRLDSDLNVLELESSLERSVQGLDYSWPALIALAQLVDQAIDATVVAFDRMGRCVLVLEVRDGTYWRILAEKTDPEAVAALKRVARLR